jgi:hypothetical protein
MVKIFIFLLPKVPPSITTLSATISLIVDGGPRYVAAYGQAHIVDSTSPDFANLLIQVPSKYLPPEKAEQHTKRMRDDTNLQAILFKLHPEKVVAIDIE